jgi:hypothetical protein
MGLKKLAAAAAMVAVATPGLAFDTKDAGTSTMFYVSIPLDFNLTRKERHWAAGLQLQGKHEYQVVNLDSRMFNFLPLGGLEAKWIIAGVVAAGATVAVGGKDKSTTSRLQSEQAAHQQAMASGGSGAPCPTPIADPCKK